jgi:uracil-DNA glycosylase
MMLRLVMTDARSIDAAFRTATELTSRDDYKIFYSRLQPSWLITIGINPGGHSNDWFEATRTGFYDEGLHDFIEYENDARYDLARPMMQVLRAATGTKRPDVLRTIPHTNMAFRRSPDSSGFKPEHRAEAAPFVQAILDVVRPRTIVFAGKACDQALDANRGFLVGQYDYEEAVPIRNGTAAIPLFRSFRSTFRRNGQAVRVVALAHPSRYATRQRPWHETMALVEATIRSERPR